RRQLDERDGVPARPQSTHPAAPGARRGELMCVEVRPCGSTPGCGEPAELVGEGSGRNRDRTRRRADRVRWRHRSYLFGRVALAAYQPEAVTRPGIRVRRPTAGP